MTDKPNTPKGTYPPQNDQADEDYVEQYFQGDSQLSELFQRMKSPEPSEQLNQAILAAAKQQASKNHWWTKPGSWAATIAIFSLIALLAHNTWKTEQDYLQYDHQQQALPGAQPKTELEIQSQPAPGAISPAPRRLQTHPEKPIQHRSKKNTRKPLYKSAPAPVLTVPSENQPAGQAEALSQEEAMDIIGNLSGIKAKESSADDSQKAIMTFEAAQEKGLPDTYSDAQQWLGKIKQLLNNDQTEKAQQLFIQFRKKYPDYPVDPVILQQLSPYKTAN